MRIAIGASQPGLEKSAGQADARALQGRGGVEGLGVDDAENQLSVAEADLEKSEGEIEFAKFNVSQTVITLPINGVVLQKYRELGDTINFGGEIQAGGGATDIAQLADLSDIRCEVDINESDIAKVRWARRRRLYRMLIRTIRSRRKW